MDSWRTKFARLWDKTQTGWRTVKAHIQDTLNTAFPETEKKYMVLLLFGIVEFMLLYIILVFDIGIWISDCSPWGMVAGYFRHSKPVPIITIVLLCGGLALGLYLHLYWKVNGNTGRGFNISNSNVYGSAREIELEELEKVASIVPKEAAMTTILGQLDQSETKLITTKTQFNFNGNIACFGPPGSGKTFCFVLPFIVQAIRRRESVICTDTKGELWAKTVEFARLHGYTVRRIDLRNPSVSDGWDVLSELRGDDMRALIMAQIVMKNTGNEKDIHASAEEALLRAVCLYVERHPSIPPESKTLYNAMAMLFEGAAALDQKFQAIKYDPSMRVAYDAYASFLQGSQNLRGNIITNLTNRLQVLSSPPVRELTSTPDVDLTLPGKTPCIYYLCVSDQHETMKFIANLFYSFAFLDLGEYADSCPDLRLPVPVNFLMEEFANLGEVPNIDKYLSTCRSRAINIMLVVQSMGQLRKIYGDDDTSTILGNCATHVCIGYNDQATAEYFEWRSGEATVGVQTEQHQHGESPIRFGKNYSTGDGRRNLYTAHELMTLDFGKIFLVWQRCNAKIADTFGINRHPAYLNGEMKTIGATVTVNLSNKEGKAFLRAMEEQRVENYENWILSGGDPWPGYTEPKPEYDGPSRGTPLPNIIPYPELERMALEHSAQAAEESANALFYEIQNTPPVQPVEDCEPFVLPEDFTWEEAPIEEDFDADNEDDDATTDDDVIADEEEDISEEEISEIIMPPRGRQNALKTDTCDSLPAEEEKSAPAPVQPPVTESMAAAAFGLPGQGRTSATKLPADTQDTIPATEKQNDIPIKGSHAIRRKH